MEFRPGLTSLTVNKLYFNEKIKQTNIFLTLDDDIRQTEGFKNVSLGNVIPASYQSSVTPFLTAEDSELLQKWRVPAFELQVRLTKHKQFSNLFDF